MQRELLEAVNRLELDTSIDYARSRVDGRIYPTKPLTGDQIDELARCLNLEVDLRVAWALADAVRGSVRNLAAFFDTPTATTSTYEQDRQSALQRIAADPARGLSDPGQSDGARAAVELLLSFAERHGLDAEARSGAVAIGDFAAELTHVPRKDARFTIGEAQLFDDIIAFIALIAPEAMSLPGNDPTPRKNAPANEGTSLQYPAVWFAEEYIGQVADRTLASFPAAEAVRERLYNLKAKSTIAVVKGLREARARRRQNEPFHTVNCELIEP